MNIESHTTPPELDDHHDPGGEDLSVSVALSITDHDGTHRLAHELVDSRDADALAAALIGCVRGIAAHHGPALQLALARRATFH